MWMVLPEDDYLRCHRWYEKKRPRELKAVLTNLDTLVTALQSGVRLQQIKVGFVHPEPAGVIAIDQRGVIRGSLAETRLYTFPDEEDETLHLLTIGDKKSQPDDIKRSREFVLDLIESKKTGARRETGNLDGSREHDESKTEEVRQRSGDAE